MFSNLADNFYLDDELKTNVAQHLEKLECEFKTYFPKISRDDLSLARNPFRPFSEKVKDELQDQLIDMKNDSSCQDVFEAFPVTNFRLRTAFFYPQISKTAPQINCLFTTPQISCLFRAVYPPNSRDYDESDKHRAPVLPHNPDPLSEIPRSTFVWLLFCRILLQFVVFSRNHQA